MLMTGARLLSIAYRKASKTLVFGLLPTYTKASLAPFATPSAHSKSRLDSPTSPVTTVDVPELGTRTVVKFEAVRAGNPEAERNASISEVLMADCPALRFLRPFHQIPLYTGPSRHR